MIIEENSARHAIVGSFVVEPFLSGKYLSHCGVDGRKTLSDFGRIAKVDDLEVALTL